MKKTSVEGKEKTLKVFLLAIYSNNGVCAPPVGRQ